MIDLVEYFRGCRDFVIQKGYGWEIEAVRARKFDNATERDFFHQYVWVVINSGLKNQVADRIFRNVFETNTSIHANTGAIHHDLKRKAVEAAAQNYKEWWATLKAAKPEDRIKQIGLLPFMGPITKYHLARNLGLDCVKPDRHLLRIARHFGYPSPYDMCSVIRDKTREPIGVVDLILWRAANLGKKP